jgi:hypothetical protein
MNNNRRNPIQVLNETYLQEFLGERSLVSSTLFSSGKCNSNYKLILDDGTEVVARVSSSNSSSREICVMGLARELVKVPEVFCERPSLMILEFLNGQILEEVPENSRLAGIAIAQFSTLTFDSRGRIEADGSISAFGFGGLQGFFDKCLGNADVLERLGEKRKGRLLPLLRNKFHLIEELDTEACLVHGDFNPSNILIHEEKLSGILDWEYALAGTPFMDIGNLLRNTDESFHSDIEQGLREGGMKLPTDWKERAELIDLTSQFEFLTSPLSEEFKLSCLQRIDRFIEKYG